MAQYLVNLTGIWLLSLLLFDIFLEKETYHGYNRLYLLITFLSGIFIPLLHQPGNIPLATGLIYQQAAHLTAVSQNIVHTTTDPIFSDSRNWLLIIYLCGALVTCFFLLKEVVLLFNLYKAGRKISIASYTIIETGSSFTPFSVGNYIFIHSKELYNDEEWEMVFTHEQQHANFRHFADLLLMQVARVLFWFHPLVYIFIRRLTMVQEFQADLASKKHPIQFGKFLIEQSLLCPAPSLSHAFNHSPIKKRITMLTKKSSPLSRTKILVVLPFLAMSLFCFTQNGYSYKTEKGGSIVLFNGNKFELQIPRPKQTTYTIDPITGKNDTTIVEFTPIAVKMNGEKVYNSDEIDNGPGTNYRSGDFTKYVFNSLNDELNELPDGEYFLGITNVVIGTKGNVVLYTSDGIVATSENTETKPAVIPEKLLKKLNYHLLKAVVDYTPMQPGMKNGKNVPYLFDRYLTEPLMFYVKNNKLIKRNNGSPSGTTEIK